MPARMLSHANPDPTAADPQAALALAESLAPSKPLPPAPLTAQERLLIRAMRSSNLTQLAELDPTREAALQTAMRAREEREVTHYIARMLAPLAIAEAIHPTATAAVEPATPTDTNSTSSEPQPNQP